MRAHPPPQHAISDVYPQRAVMLTYAHGSISANVLEVKGRMRRVLPHERKLLVRELANRRRECLVAMPEARRRVMRQRGRERPA